MLGLEAMQFLNLTKISSVTLTRSSWEENIFLISPGEMDPQCIAYWMHACRVRRNGGDYPHFFLLLLWKSNPEKWCSYFSSNCRCLMTTNKVLKNKIDWSETKNRPCVKIADQNSLPKVFGGHAEHTSMVSFKKLQHWPPPYCMTKRKRLANDSWHASLLLIRSAFTSLNFTVEMALDFFPSMHISF